MGKLLVVGSVALDTVKTPFGEVTEVLGGSATYFSTAASYFTSVDLIAVVGEDFPDAALEFLKSRDIDLTGLERRPGATFRWKGEYTHQLNEAQTLDTQPERVRDLPSEDSRAQYRSPGRALSGQYRSGIAARCVAASEAAAVSRLRHDEFLDQRQARCAMAGAGAEWTSSSSTMARRGRLGEDPNLVKVAKNILSRGPEASHHQARRIRRA